MCLTVHQNRANHNGVTHRIPYTNSNFEPQLADEIPTPAVFATDIILAALMCSIRSIYPWDLVITKHDGKIFIDKRDGVLDFVTVNENTPEPPADNTDDMNGSSSLGLEATYINRNFSQMVLKDVRLPLLTRERNILTPKPKRRATNTCCPTLTPSTTPRPKILPLQLYIDIANGL